MNCVVGNLQLVSVLSHLCVMTNGLETGHKHTLGFYKNRRREGLSDRETKIRNTYKQPKSSSTLEEVEGYCGHCQYMCGIQAIVGTASTCVVYKYQTICLIIKKCKSYEAKHFSGPHHTYTHSPHIVSGLVGQLEPDPLEND